MFLGMQDPAHIQSHLSESNHLCPNFFLIFPIFAQIQSNFLKSDQFLSKKNFAKRCGCIPSSYGID